MSEDMEKLLRALDRVGLALDERTPPGTGARQRDNARYALAGMLPEIRHALREQERRLALAEAVVEASRPLRDHIETWDAQFLDPSHYQSVTPELPGVIAAMKQDNAHAAAYDAALAQYDAAKPPAQDKA